LGDVIAAPMDMVLSSHRVVQPDIAFICKERFHIIKRVIEGPADLVAEIVSLGGRERDRIEKKDLYEQYGVREYWIIDPEAGTVEVFHLENQAYTLHGQFRAGETATSALLQEFNINVESLLKPS